MTDLLWQALSGDLSVDGSMRRAAQLRKDLTAWEKTGDRLMERLVEERTDAERSRVDVAQRLSKPTAAYMDAHMAGDEKERVELVTIQDAPLPPLHEDNS